MDDVSKQLLAEIELEVSKPTYLTFFITAEYIEKRYYSLIKRIIDAKTGNNVSIVFIADTTSKPTQRKKEETASGPLFADVVKKQTISKSLRIRRDYTFETFAVFDSNQLAYTAANAIASQPGGKYNPLFIYGTVGVGKTHLMNAVANKIIDNNPDAIIVYLTTEEFTNEVVEAIRDKTTTQMRRKFRNTELLLLDDVQFLSGKEKVQEELFHTFNALVDKGKQIVFSSDKPPSEIKKLEARLASRFEGGLTVDIQPPDFELRLAILEIKARKHNLDIHPSLLHQIAEKVVDARALEGYLLRLITESQARGGEITQDIVSRAIGKQKQLTKTIHPDDIIDAICYHFRIKPTQLKGAKRDASLVLPRHICMYLMKEEAGLTHVEIGNLLGGRDHTTVMHGVEKVRKLVENEGRVKEEIMSIRRFMNEDSV